MAGFATNKSFYLVDTTLRDGEQTPGVAFSVAEKVEIARLLDAVGVDQIEAGTPAMGGDEALAMKLIAAAGLRASIMAWNRALISDIEASLTCGVDAVEISSPVSDDHIRLKLRSSRAEVLEKTRAAVAFAKKHGLYISVGMEDATRADEAFLAEYAAVAKAAGAHRLRYCDTVGVLEPLAVFERVKRLRTSTAMEIEIHAHNDFGMATANTVTALRAGARFLGVTVNGLGERAGNAALEEVIMALRHSGDAPASYNAAKLRRLCHFVAKASGRPIPAGKSVVGEEIFHHESGIHADGVLKHAALYEPYDPAEVGLQRRIIIGKHSGKAALLHKVKELGLPADETSMAALADKIKGIVRDKKKSLTDEEIRDIADF